MRHVFVFALLTFVLSACGGAPATVTAQGVLDQFKAAGLSVENVKPGQRAEGTPAPNSYKENLTFTIASLGDKGGQVFVCDTKRNCDAMFAYFDALKALAGPYLYQSTSGTVVVQLNSGLTPDEAAKYEQVIKVLP